MAKAVREVDGKAILVSYFNVLRANSENGTVVGKTLQFPLKSATVRPDTDFSKLIKEHPWLETEVRLMIFVINAISIYKIVDGCPPKQCNLIWLGR